MLKHGTCPNCNAQAVLKNLPVIDRGHMNGPHELTIGIERKPIAFVIMDLYQTPLRAWVCGACGYTELFAQNPHELRSIYHESHQD